MRDLAELARGAGSLAQDCHRTGQINPSVVRRPTVRESAVESPKTLQLLQERHEAGLHCESNDVPQFCLFATVVVVGRRGDNLGRISREKIDIVGQIIAGTSAVIHSHCPCAPSSSAGA